MCDQEETKHIKMWQFLTEESQWHSENEGINHFHDGLEKKQYVERGTSTSKRWEQIKQHYYAREDFKWYEVGTAQQLKLPETYFKTKLLIRQIDTVNFLSQPGFQSGATEKLWVPLDSTEATPFLTEVSSFSSLEQCDN